MKLFVNIAYNPIVEPQPHRCDRVDYNKFFRLNFHFKRPFKRRLQNVTYFGPTVKSAFWKCWEKKILIYIQMMSLSSVKCC